MNITADLFTRLFPTAKTPELWAAALNQFCPQYGIDTLPRMVAFLAQCGHESCGFTALSENLNYSSTALLRVWPKRFNQETAELYARKPEAIANHVYANRMGNGDEASGDGWKFRGKGLIQLTGRDNHAAFAKHAGISIDVIGGYLLSIEGAVQSACWFWQTHGCNVYADRGDVKGCTKAINGGLNGLEDRTVRYAKTEEVLHVA